MSEPATVRVELPMVCTCQDAGRADAAKLTAEVISRLAMGGPELSARDIEPANLVSEVIMSLNWDLENRVHIESIGCDQWFLIRAVSRDGTEILIHADKVEDGLAALWKHFADVEHLATNI